MGRPRGRLTTAGRRLIAVGLVLAHLLVLLSLFLAHRRGAEEPATPAAGLAGRIIVVDPGHGGRDPGAMAGGVSEKDVVLDIALILRDLLREAGAAVVMVREADVDLSQPIHGRKKITDLMARVEIVRQTSPDLYVSIHANIIGSSRWRGAQVFYNAKDDRNRVLAAHIQAELSEVYGVPRGVARDRRQYILKQVEVPAVCVEAGFLSNAADRRMLQTPAEQRRIAWGISRGIAAYLRAGLLPAGSTGD